MSSIKDKTTYPTFERLNERHENLKFHTLDMPITEMNITFNSIIERLIGFYKTYSDHIRYIETRINDRIIDQKLIQDIGSILLDVQDFWDIVANQCVGMRSICSPNFSSKYSEFTKTFNDEIMINTLPLQNEDCVLTYKETLSEVLISLCTLKREYDKFNILKNQIKDEEKMNDIWWSFYQQMKETLSDSIKNYKSFEENDVTPNLDNLYIFKIIKNIDDYFDVISDDKVSKESVFNTTTIGEFILIHINYLLYVYKNKLLTKLTDVYNQIDELKESKRYIDLTNQE